MEKQSSDFSWEEKLIRVDLENDKITEEIICSGHPLEFYAGRSLSSKIVHDEVPPLCNPLGADNKLIIAAGFLSGTNAPSSGKLSIGAKSPLTGGIKESNVGGRAPAYLGKQGIRCIIFENISDSFVIIIVKDGKVSIEDASEIAGLNNYDSAKWILDKYGNKAGAFIIGSAGEQLFRAASIASIDMEGYPSRHAGRGGMGAVMGSKRIKAVVLIPPNGDGRRIFNKEQFKSMTKAWFKEKYEASRTFSKYGTPGMVKAMSELHGLPTQNFRRGKYEDADKISGEALLDYISKNNGKSGIACSPGCCIMCSNMVLAPDGTHITSALEYETIGLNGSNLLINDIEKLAWIDHFTDDAGLDSIETGNCFAMFMEAGKIKWGDADKVIEIIKKVKDGKNASELSKMLALGCKGIGEKLNISRIPHVKGQGFPAYDPRSFKGMGVTFMTSPMGADHTAGPAIANRKAYANKEYGATEDPAHKVELSKELQLFIMIMDSMGQCYFLGPSYEITERLVKILYARFGKGWDRSTEDWLKWARHCLLMERDFNLQAGIKPEDDKLPDFILNEPLEMVERKWDVDKKELEDFWKSF